MKYYTIRRKRNFNTLTGVLFLLVILLAMIGGEINEYKRNHQQPLLRPISNSGTGNVNDLAIVHVDNGENASVIELAGVNSDAKPSTTEKDLIALYAKNYNVSEKLVTCIIAKESSFNPEAIGDHGLAKGFAQFHLATWIRMRKQAGLSTTDLRTDKAEAIRTLCFGLASGRGREWTTFKKCI